MSFNNSSARITIIPIFAVTVLFFNQVNLPENNIRLYPLLSSLAQPSRWRIVLHFLPGRPPFSSLSRFVPVFSPDCRR